MDADRASRTAVLVCQGRAAAHGRIAEGRFADPVAMALLRDSERVAVRRVREGAGPQGWAERVEFEMVRASAEVIAPRTVAIDDAVRARRVPQLVIVGAGLDDRAWRMPELASADVFEIDHPASQRDKRDRVADLRPLAKSVRFVPVDFTRDRSMRAWRGQVTGPRRSRHRSGRALCPPRPSRGRRHRPSHQQPIGGGQPPDRQLPVAGAVGRPRPPGGTGHDGGGTAAQPLGG